MSASNFNLKPEDIARTFSQYAKMGLQVILWTIICLASLGAACIALSGIWVAVKYALKIIF